MGQDASKSSRVLPPDDGEENLSLLIKQMLASSDGIDIDLVFLYIVNNLRANPTALQGLLVPKKNDSKRHPLFYGESPSSSFCFADFLPCKDVESPEPLRSILIRLSAVIITRAFAPRPLYRELLLSQSSGRSVNFLMMREIIETSFRFSRLLRQAHITALSNLMRTDRIFPVFSAEMDEGNPVLNFLKNFQAFPPDLLSNVLWPMILNEDPVPEDVDENGSELIVCKDHVKVWIRCKILQRQEDKISITFENWAKNWDQDFDATDWKLVRPWVSPHQRMTRAPRVLSEKMLKAAEYDIFELLHEKTGYFSSKKTFI
jgi:hypothetical protein